MPTPAQMRAAGFTPEDYEAEEIEIWAENADAFRLFRRLRTQWRVGVAGATGLDHGVLFQHLAVRNLGAEECDDIVDDVVVMEEAALAAMRKDRE
jgi:hypothetical protein